MLKIQNKTLLCTFIIKYCSQSSILHSIALSQLLQVILKPCPHWRLRSPNSATVAEFGDCHRKRRLSPKTATFGDCRCFGRLSPNSATNCRRRL